MRNQSDRHRDRQQQSRRVGVWGCDIHQTPAGETCQGLRQAGLKRNTARDETQKEEG